MTSKEKTQVKEWLKTLTEEGEFWKADKKDLIKEIASMMKKGFTCQEAMDCAETWFSAGTSEYGG